MSSSSMAVPVGISSLGQIIEIDIDSTSDYVHNSKILLTLIMRWIFHSNFSSNYVVAV